jgi:hypothetical protein
MSSRDGEAVVACVDRVDLNLIPHFHAMTLQFCFNEFAKRRINRCEYSLGALEHRPFLGRCSPLQ